MTDLQDLIDTVYTVNEDKGWHNRWNTLARAGDREGLLDHTAAKIGLIGCEVAEAIEELRTHGLDTAVYYAGDKPEGVAVELADIVIRTLDTAALLGIDLPAVIDEKLAYNSTRPHMHGRKL